MKIAYLSIPQFIAAILIAVSIAVVFTYATAPHRVDVPTVVITPVPTPAPVIIGQPQVQPQVYVADQPTEVPWWLSAIGLVVVAIVITAIGYVEFTGMVADNSNRNSMNTCANDMVSSYKNSMTMVVCATVAACMLVVIDCIRMRLK